MRSFIRAVFTQINFLLLHADDGGFLGKSNLNQSLHEQEFVIMSMCPVGAHI